MSIPANSHHATLVLGGARSGKSRHALALAEGCAAAGLFLATAEPFDHEMRQRIQAHRAERGPAWRTRECPLRLDQALAPAALPEGVGVVLIDCLTVWLGNLLHHERDVHIAIERLILALDRCPLPAVLVSNEVGAGVVPETPLGRRFRDEQGRLNQRLAARSGRVDLVVAGLTLRLKGEASGAAP